MINSFFSDLLTAAIIASPFIIIVLLISFFYRRHKQKPFNWLWDLACALFLISLVNILWNTVSFAPFSHGFQIHQTNINLIPIVSLIKMATYLLEESPTPYIIMNIFGNILFFLPVGFLLPFLSQKFSRVWKTILLGALLSIMIETWQLFLPRGTDIDDVLLNTSGTALGYCLFWLISSMFPKFVARVQE